MTSVTELADGSLRGPGGVVCRRTPRRVKRSEAAALVDMGAAVVTDVYPRAFVGSLAERRMGHGPRSPRTW